MKERDLVVLFNFNNEFYVIVTIRDMSRIDLVDPGHKCSFFEAKPPDSSQIFRHLNRIRSLSIFS